MQGHTHALFGLTTVVAVNAATHFVQPHVIRGVPAGLALCAGAAILGTLAPDIDAEDSSIQREFGLAGSAASLGLRSLGMKHRGLTHTGLITLVVLVVSHLVSGWVGYPDAGLAFGLGYFSHVAIADAMTRHGVPLWWPLSKRRFHLLPRAFRVRTGGPAEMLVSLLVGAALIWMGWDAVVVGLLAVLK